MTPSHEPDTTAALRACGQLLRRLRHAAALTREPVAERPLVSPRSISELERGSTHWPRIDTITLLADGLELTGAERSAFVGLARGRYAPDATSTPGTPVVCLRLPAPPTPIIGREAERAATLAALRDPQVRLLPLVGSGGAGRTRLALDLAQHAAPAFRDGVQFVDLAPLRDPTFLYDVIARALALQRDAFANWRRFTNCPRLLRGLAHFALIASGDAAHGALLLSAAAAERTRIGGSQPDNDRAINERDIAHAQAALGADAYAALWAEGETLPLPDAIALALR